MGSPENGVINGGLMPLSLLESASLGASLDDNSALTELQKALKSSSLSSDPINSELGKPSLSNSPASIGDNQQSNPNQTANYTPSNGIFDNGLSITQPVVAKTTPLLKTSNNNQKSATTQSVDSLTGNTADASLIGINNPTTQISANSASAPLTVQTQQTTSQTSTLPFAIRTDGTISINGGGDFDGVPTDLTDDALIYAAKGFTINGNPTLPVQRNAQGNPIRDANGKLILIDRAVTVASGYTTINGTNNQYANLIPPQVVAQQTITVPAYADIKLVELNRRIPAGTPTVTFNISQNPINNANDWTNKFPPPGTTSNPKVVKVIGGGLNVPANVSLSNYVITVDQGDINFNGNGQNFNNVVLIANNGNINLSNVQSRDLSVFASSSINMNAGARFAGYTTIANGSSGGNITFNGATTTTNTSDNLKVISAGDITYNGASDTRGLFLSVKNFTFNGSSTLYGSISAKGNIIFNGQATVIGVAELMPDITPPVITATLACDTAPFGQTNKDFITFDATITGTVTDANPILEFRASFNNTPSANYTNVIAQSNSDGSFSFSRSQLETINGGTLSDGVYTLHLQAKDLYGNLSDTFNLTFTLDTATLSPNNLDLRTIDDSGSSNTDNITNKNTPTIIGQAETGAVVQLFNNGQTIGQATANNTGVWQIVTSSLTDGIYNLTATANDIAGNVSNKSTPLSVTIDTTLPLLTLNTPVDAVPLTPGARLTGSIDGTGSAVTTLSYHFNNLAEITVPFNATGAFDQSLNLTGLANGAHTLTITATDTAGNIKTIQYHVTIVIDQEAPVISASLLHDTAPNGQTNSDRITFDPTISGTVIDASRVVEFKAGFDNTLAVSFTNVTAFRNADGSFTFDRSQLETIYGGTLPDGFHTLHLQAVDEFHNTSNIFNFSFTFDSTTSEPIFNLNAVSDSGVVGDFHTKFDTVTLTGLAEANSTVVLEQTGAVTTSDNNGQFTFAHVQLAIGDNSLIARSTDIAGNENTFSTNIYRFSPPTAINLAGNTVAENSSTGTVIGQLVSTDPDPGDTHSYTLENNADGRFRIVGNQLQVANGTLLNFESSTQHSVTVTSTDANGLSLTQVFAIAVTNVNEAPSFTSTPISTSNSGSLYTYNIVAADPDAIESLRFTTNNLPSWLTLVDNLNGTAILSGTPRDFLSNINSNIHLLVTDASGLTAIQDFTIAPSTYEVEENNFTVFRSLPLTIPATPSILSFQIDPQFDTTGVNSIHDAIDVALVDANGNSLVHTVASERDAFFNWTEGESTVFGAGASYDAATHTVSLNLTGINPGTNAQLVFRLVNNDGDISTSVRITNFALINAPNGTQAPVQTDFGTQISQTTAPNFNLLTDVSSSIGSEYHRTSFNADTHLLYADIALRNTGSYSVDSPLIVAVNHISDPTILVRKEDGFTPDGVPYYDFNKLVGDRKFDPNELTLQRSLVFYNPQGVQFTYDLTVLAQLNAAPMIQTQANKEIIAGHSYSYDVNATDPNGDSLTYKLLVAPDGMTIDQTTGLIGWNTAASNTGNQTVIVEVNDGRGGIAQQQYSLSVIDAPPNRPPIFTSTPIVDAKINQSYTYKATAKDPDFDSLTYSLVNPPIGMTIDGSTGQIAWTPTTTSLQAIQTQPTTYFGEDLNFTNNDAVRMTNAPYSSAANNEFFSRLIGSGTEDFEGFTNGTSPTTLHFGTDSATVTGSVSIKSVPQGTTYNGVFPTSGEQTLFMFDATPPLFQLNFNVAQAAIGFYVTDLGDGGGQLNLTLANGATKQIQIPHNIDANISGSKFYFGYIDAANPFTKVTFSASTSSDGYGIDDITVARPEQVKLLTDVPVIVRTTDGRSGVADQSFKINVQPEPGNHAPIIISEPVTQFYSPSSTLDGVVFGLKSQAPGSNASSQAPTKLFSFNVNGSNFKDLGVVTLNNSQIDADGLAVSEKYGLLGFALSSTGSTLISINSNTSVAKALGIPLADREIRGAVFDLDDNLWVIDVAKSELLNLNPLDGSILKSTALKFSGQPLSLLDGADIAVDGQGQFYLTTYSSVANGSSIYTLDITTGALTQLISDPGQYLAGMTFASADNTSHLFGYEVNLTDDIYSYDPNANYARTILFPNIISEFNSGRGDLAAIVRKPRYSYSVQAIDLDNDSLNYSLVIAPTGMKIDSSTGSISWDNPVASTTPYDVTVQVQDGRGGIDTQEFILQVNTGTRPSEIRGTIWEDLDSDGVRDPGERGLSGVQVYLDLNKNGLFDNNEPTTNTNEQSEYKFTTLSAGTYIVREVLPNGFAYTSPQPTPLFSSNLIQNGSFEQGPNTNDFAIVGAGSNVIPYWNVTIGSVDYVIKSYWQSSDGNISIDLTGSPENGGLSQSFSTIPSKNYLVTFDLSTNPSVNAGQGIPMIVKAAGQSATFIGVSSGNYQDMKYFTYTWQFSANSATTTLEFSSQSPFYARGPVLDKVSVAEIISQNDFKQVVNLVAGEIASDINFGNSRINQSIVNNQPTFTSSNPPTTAIVGELWQYHAAATDLDKDVLTYELIVKPQGMIVDPTTGIVRWKPTLQQSTGNLVQLGGFDTNSGEKPGVYDIIIAVRDGNNGIDLQTFQIQVVAPNTTPVFTNFPTNQLEATVNYPIQYQFKAQDAEGDPITYSLDASAPNGATLNPITGVLSWKPTAVGNSTFNIIANDNKGGTTSQSINITVSASAINANPFISSQPPKIIALGQNYLYTVQANDSNYDPVTITLETAPQGMTIDQLGRITWQPGATQIGSNPVSIKISDGRGGVITQAFNIDVVSTTYRVNNAPSITSTPNLVTNLERTYAYNLSGNDSDGDLLLWSLDSSPVGMVIDAQSGTLRWQPQKDQIGEHTVAVRLTDAYGLYVGQEFTLNVTGVNTPSAIVSNPITRAAQNQLYTYSVVATDPENDPLTFSFGRKPAGMTIDNNGTIRWTPQALQIGSQEVEVLVRDGQGAVTTQIYTIEVGTTAINHPPSITSTPVYLAAVGSAYSYQVQATDSDAGDRLTYQLLSVPAGVTGMTIDPTTGLLTWNNPVAGNYKIVVGAVDAAGLGAAQGFTLTARVNNAPVIRSTPVLTATPGSTYSYDVIATDVDGDRLSYTLDQTSRDLGMTLDTLGRLRWTPTTGNVGSHTVVITVNDANGANQQQHYNLSVAADMEAPKVRLIANYDLVNLGESITFQARATDNIKLAGLQLLINNTPVVLDSNGMATFKPPTAGTITAKAIATDTAGNIGQATFNVAVIDTSDVNAPDVSLDLGAIAGGTVTGAVDIKGTVSDDNLDYYRLLVAPIGSSDFKEIFRGTNTVNDGVLGKFDPSLLENDSYTLRLEAHDKGGNVSFVEDTVNVSGELKLGNFRLSFTDLSIPVTGIPITLTRTYDSLTSGTTDDFGYGWRMEFRDTDLRTSVGKPSGEVAELGGQNPFKDGTKVYVTLPGGKREGFTFKPTIEPLSQYLRGAGGVDSDPNIYHPSFLADAGVTDTLTMQNTRIIHGAGTNQYYGLAGSAYNPADTYYGGVYTLTTKEGIVYQIDAATGDLLTVTDTNGNTLTYTDADITSSTGQKITFGRDAQGRIATVTDPAGKQIHYQYNTQGDLVSVTDREGNTTTMEYDQERSHYLDKIIDPLGRTGVKNEYGDDGRLKEIIDVNGQKVEMSYDPNNSRQTVLDQLGHATVYEYDARGNILTEIDAEGQITKRTYDDNNYVLEETVISDRSGPNGFTTKYTYDSQGNQLTQEDALHNVTIYTYGDKSRLLTETDALGRTTTNVYSRSGNLRSTTDALGHTSSYDYDLRGQLRSVKDANSKVTGFDYDDNGNVTSVTDALGNVTTYTYNTNGDKLTETRQMTVANAQVRELLTTWTYDDNGRMKTMTDAENHTTTYEYDKLGHQTAVIDALQHKTEYKYDDKGQLVATIYADDTPDNPDDNLRETSRYDQAGRKIAIIDKAGRETRFIYDKVGRLRYSISPDSTPDNPNISPELWDNPKTETVYYDDGLVKAQIDERGNGTEFRYDADGRQTQVIYTDDTPATLTDNPRTTYSYDKTGQRIAETDALNHITTFNYDDLGRLTKTEFNDKTYTTNEYDNLGRRIAMTDQNNKRTEYSYDALGRLTLVKNALQDLTEYGYNEVGNLISQTDANQHITGFEYDGLGHRTATILPLGQRSDTTYDAVGHVQTYTDFNRNTTTYQYDSMNWMTLKQFQDRSKVTYTHTDTGLQDVITFVDANGQTTATYDYDYNERDRLVKRTDNIGGVSRNISYTYDAANNRTSVTTASGTVNYTFDVRNSLDQVIENGVITAHYDYDAVSNLVRTTFANGTQEIRSYDDLNRLKYLENHKGDTILSSYTYSLDKVGNRTKVVEHDGRTVDYTYDDLYRLTQEKITDAVNGNRIYGYTYDKVGNRNTKSETVNSATTVTNYVYDANDQLLNDTVNQQIVANYTYDNNGNTLSKNENGITTEYTWNYENRLIAASVKDANGTTKQSMQYRYNDRGIRVAARVDGVETRYLIDEMQPYAQVLEEYSPSGAVQVKYVYGNDLIAQEKGSDRTFYHVDGLGSTRILTDATGSVVSTYDYEAYGELISSTGGVANKYLFAGEQFDENLEDYYNRTRYYDADTGRFTRRDTYEGRLGEPLSLHKYIYASDNPVSYVDPTGFFATSLGEANAVLAMLSDLAATTTATFIRTVAAARVRLFAAGLLSAGVAITLAADQALLDAQWEEQEKRIAEAAAASTSCGTPLFHYTDTIGETEIIASQSIRATATYVGADGFAHPPGAYATSLPPVGPFTQRELKNLYKGGNQSWDVSRFVMMCSNIDPFYPTGYPGEWVNPAPAGTFVSVTIVFAGINLMPPG